LEKAPGDDNNTFAILNLTSYSRLFEGIFYKKLPIFTQFSFQKSPNFHHFFSNQPFYKFGEGIG